ncbi:MAG: hypothetical protein RL745_634 [Actinomycetota bacterium]
MHGGCCHVPTEAFVTRACPRQRLESATMAKPTRAAAFTCSECGWQTAKWVGRCGECQTWGSVTERNAAQAPAFTAGVVSAPAVPIASTDITAATAQPTGLDELDRVLGGGLVPGSLVLVAGEPGIGKSTLLLSTLAGCSSKGQRTLYVTGEESAAQVRARAERIQALHDDLYLAAETDLASVLAHIDAVQPKVLVIDSVQTLQHPLVEGTAGGVSQIREVTAALMRISKERGIACIVVGHVTKEGAIAGPRMLEHLVDVVLHIEGDRHTRLRLLRCVKNRFGAADEIGCFELTDAGMWAVADPSGLFVTRRTESVPGTCITVTLEGSRPLVTEVQALVGASTSPSPRRATHGVDSSRVAMILAVLERRAGVRLADRDVYVSTVGGVRLSEPAVDMAILLAVASASTQVLLPTGTLAFGEVGLAGEIRNVNAASRRLAEAERLGFTQAFIPAGTEMPESGTGAVSVTQVADVRDALAALARD